MILRLERIVLAGIFLLAAICLHADFNMYSGSRTIGANEYFYDTGGISGYYYNSESLTLTLYPATPGKVWINMNSFSSEADYDYLRIYDGPNTSSPRLREWTGAVSAGAFVQSTSSDGSLTIHWYTDGSVTYEGWTATVGYTPSIPAVPVATMATSISPTSLRANWNSSSGASSYYVELSTDSGFSSYNRQYTGNTWHDFSALSANTRYYYRVAAYNTAGNSSYSNTISTTTLVANPSNVSATPSTISPGQSSNLSATSNNSNIRWYTQASGGTPIGTSASEADFSVSPASSTTYYAEAYSEGNVASLSDVLSSFNSNYSSIVNTIPSYYNFAMDGPGGVNANCIHDGGNDMYDPGGNYLATDYQSQIYYSDNTIISSAAFGSGGMYFTRHVPGMFILAADMNNVLFFQITGNNGADGGGSANGTVLNITVNGIAYSCFLKRVYGTGDPSINQMIIIPQNSSASHWYASDTDSSGQHVININANTRLYYLLYAGRYGDFGVYIDDTNATNIATTFLSYVAGSSEIVSSGRTAVTVTIRNIPNIAGISSPADNASDVAVNTELEWLAPASGDQPSQYNIYLDTENPPQALVETLADLDLSFDPGTLMYNTTYYWQIVPTNETGDAQNCPVWSFETTDLFVADNLDPVIPNPEQPDFEINPGIQISGINGSFNPTIQTAWNPPDQPFTNAGLAISISNVPLGGRTIVIDPGLGFVPRTLAYRKNLSSHWIQVLKTDDWTESYVYFTVLADKDGDDLDIIFPMDENQTLAIALSTFTAIYTGSTNVQIKWVVASETDHLGYNILRSETQNMNYASRINTGIITQGLAIGSEMHYNFLDAEAQSGYTYYYWLESLCLSGSTTYYGPVLAVISEGPADIPPIPLLTSLGAAYPNPFNPTVTLPYQLSKASLVTIEIFNIKGQRVSRKVINHSVPGHFKLFWDAKDEKGYPLPTGIYYYRMNADNYQMIKKMTLKK